MSTEKDDLILVPPENILPIWSRVQRFVEAANDWGGNKFAPHHWAVRVLSGQADLFTNQSLSVAAVCEPQAFPLRNVYVVVLLGGMGGCDWDGYQQVLEDRCKQLNCSAIEIYGRKGWKKILEKRGAELAHCVWRKEL